MRWEGQVTAGGGRITFAFVLCPCSDAFDLNFGVVIFRLRAGFDATERMDEAQRGMYVCVWCVYAIDAQHYCLWGPIEPLVALQSLCNSTHVVLPLFPPLYPPTSLPLPPFPPPHLIFNFLISLPLLSPPPPPYPCRVCSHSNQYPWAPGCRCPVWWTGCDVTTPLQRKCWSWVRTSTPGPSSGQFM